MKNVTQLIDGGDKIGRVLGNLRHQSQHCGGIFTQNRRHQIKCLTAINGAQHFRHLSTGQTALPISNRLISQTQRIAHRALCGARDEGKRLGI